MLKTIGAIALGIIVGLLLAFIAIPGILIPLQWNALQTTVNSWSTTQQAGKMGNNILEQAALAEHLFAANVPEEATYWSTTVDSAGHTLTGQHDYIMHFPSGGLPPNSAFWSITMYYTNYTLVDNLINRYEISDRSLLPLNTDGSLDIYIQNTPPTGHESNWLPAPTGNFMLFLRVSCRPRRS